MIRGVANVKVLTLSSVVSFAHCCIVRQCVQVPPGTQHLSKVVMRGKGAASVTHRGAVGHQYVHFSVEIPNANSLTTRQVELLKEFSTEEESKVKDGSKSMFRKLKDLVNL